MPFTFVVSSVDRKKKKSPDRCYDLECLYGHSVLQVRPEKKYENRSGGGFVSGVYEVRTLAVTVKELPGE